MLMLQFGISSLVFLCLWPISDSKPVVFGYEDPSRNLIHDWDFEEKISNDDWILRSGLANQKLDPHTGNYSLKIYGRTSNVGGVYQRVYRKEAGLKKNTNYYFSIFFKLLTRVPEGSYCLINIYAKIWLTGGGKVVHEIGKLPFQQRDGLWKQLGGDFKSPDKDFDSFEFYVKIGPDLTANYLLDTASLIELEKHSNWPAYLDTKINKHRRSDLTVRVELPSGTDLSNTKIKVGLTRHEFGFGVAIKSLHFIRNKQMNQNYRKFILDNFNWVVFENDMKWNLMEKVKGVINHQRLDQVIDILLQHNVTVRGHTLLWAIRETNPSWVLPETGRDMLTEVKRRINYAVTLFKGKVAEWDVCNEILHQRFFEDATGVLNMLLKELHFAHRADPQAKLFLNDYEIVRNGKLTSAQGDLARFALANGAPLHGIGIQSHLRILPMDMEVVEKRIQIASSVGLPVSISELSFHSYDEDVKARAADLIMRLYFSEPGVHSATLWGFSDLYGFSFSDDMYLTNGEDFRPNKAGQAILDLIKGEWNTTKTFTPSSSLFTATFPAVHGNYKLTVTTGRQVLAEKDFYVAKGGNNHVKLTL